MTKDVFTTKPENLGKFSIVYLSTVLQTSYHILINILSNGRENKIRVLIWVCVWWC